MSSANAPNLALQTGGKVLWIDTVKGIGIILVVFGHVLRGLINSHIIPSSEFITTLDSIIYTFHMPLFFFLAGLFYFPSLKKYGGLLLVGKKVDTIVYPYLFWSLTQGLTEIAMGSYTNSKTSLTEVLSLLWLPRAQFWFLYALFLIFLLAVCVFRTKSTTRYVALSLITLTLFFINPWFLTTETAQLVPDVITFHLGTVIRYFFFFISGAMLTTHGSITQLAKGSWLISITLLFALCQYILHGPLGLTYTGHHFINLLAPWCGIAWCISFALFLSHHSPLKWLQTLGHYSMAIYLIHTFCASGTRIVLDRIFAVDNSTIHLGLGMLAGILIPLVIARITEKLNWRWPFALPISKWIKSQWRTTPPSQ